MQGWQCNAEAMPLVHDGQLLRLNWRELIPDSLVLGEWFDVSVGCSNETGMWRRADFPSSGDGGEIEGLPLVVSVVAWPSDKTLHLAVEAECERVLVGESMKTSFRVRFVLAEGVSAGASEEWSVLFGCALADDAQRSWRSVLPVFSSPLRICATLNRSTLDVTHAVQCRLLAVPSLDQKLLVSENPGDLGIGGKLWDSSAVLLDYFCSDQYCLKGRSCLELGSGTGYLGMCCALLGAGKVCLTDLTDVTENIRKNLELNTSVISGCHVEVRAHHWGTDVADLNPASIDLVLMSDVVYDNNAFEALITSLRALHAGGAKEFLMGFRHRNEDDVGFFERLCCHFEVENKARSSVTSPLQCPRTGSDVCILQLRPLV